MAFEGPIDVSGRLSSSEEFADTNFVVDVRLNKSDSNVVISAGPVFRIDLLDPTVASHLQKTGHWNRIEAVVEAGKHWVKINGSRIPVDSPEGVIKGKGKVILKPTGPVDFCNLYAAP